MLSKLEERRNRFEKEMRANGPLIYTLAVRLTGNPVEGQDLAAQTFVMAYEHLAEFRDESAIGTWFYRICINLWKNKVRAERRQLSRVKISNVHARHEDAPESEIPGLDAPLTAVLETADRQEAVRQALKQLGPEERALVILRDMDDLSYEEISELLEVPIGTVKSRISRVRDHMRQILAPVIHKVL